ncbi:hematopoietic SH2 domain-containing protein homolog [Phyllopteryx taeniolatus]|uniref:hematopoietic SH2 domain-containing protein homolog n=1 Tax=Phyllopteryx taeniolatus TaxID=161469 RepID=UPI002AD3982D|nr:hematopoietic SH2 domain-containing protein homolog [Phyllopteryx taeniolatus]
MTELSQPSQPQNNIWFVSSQATWIKNGFVPEWFHGRISRKAAEEHLMSKPPGSFLIRVSESRVGYTLSYRAVGCFRHFMIEDMKDGSCAIVGERLHHPSLQQLVDFHQTVPIAAHNEVLTLSCGKTSVAGNKYSGISAVDSNKRHIIAKELRPNHQNNNEHRSHTHPAMPVPKSRKRYITDITLPVKPLETPPESLLTPPKTQVAPPPTSGHENETNTKRNTPCKTDDLQEMTWEELFDAALSAYNDEGEMLPKEYSPPPPFAPGYQTEEA